MQPVLPVEPDDEDAPTYLDLLRVPGLREQVADTYETAVLQDMDEQMRSARQDLEAQGRAKMKSYKYDYLKQKLERKEQTERKVRMLGVRRDKFKKGGEDSPEVHVKMYLRSPRVRRPRKQT